MQSQHSSKEKVAVENTAHHELTKRVHTTTKLFMLTICDEVVLKQNLFIIPSNITLRIGDMVKLF